MIVATAGHVDHGKTSLVKNLTGVETDRLEEEQRRGLSIELGYAYWRPDEKTVVGFIDVPGHRRFINNMISGVSGIDLGMLVVAADDGPMPQTQEHLHVMQLLGVEDYLLVVTKTDRVSEQRLQQVCADAASLLPRGTPIFRVSNATGDGVDDLRKALQQRASQQATRDDSGHFRMSLDRAFHLQGRGLIVTGTVTSGVVNEGDTLLLQPQGKQVRVRGVHTQDSPSPSGRTGERCALNVAGDFHRDDIERGDWVASPSCIEPTCRFDARVSLLEDAAFPLKHLAEVKLHIGAKHLKAKMMILQGEGEKSSRIHPGDSALVQFITDRPVLCCRGDRFLLRDHGETATLGGGRILDPHGPERQKSSPARLAWLAAMEMDDVEDAIKAVLSDDRSVINFEQLARSWNLGAENPVDGLDEIVRINSPDGELWTTDKGWGDLKKTLLNGVLAHHRRNPREAGIQATELMKKLPTGFDSRLLQPALNELVASAELSNSNGLLSAGGFRAEPTKENDRDWQIIASSLRKYGRQIPNLAQLEEDCGLAAAKLKRSVEEALKDRRAIRINENRVAETPVLREYADTVLQMSQATPQLTVKVLRDQLGCGRNVLIEVLEYFDSIGFTRRVGNARIVLDKTQPEKKFAGQQTFRKSDVPGGAPGLQNQ